MIAAYEYDLVKQNKLVYMSSRLFIYYKERLIEYTTNSDLGSSLKDGIDAICKYGVIQETQWPYDINKFTKKPPDTLYDNAKKNIVIYILH